MGRAPQQGSCCSLASVHCKHPSQACIASKPKHCLALAHLKVRSEMGLVPSAIFLRSAGPLGSSLQREWDGAARHAAVQGERRHAA